MAVGLSLRLLCVSGTDAVILAGVDKKLIPKPSQAVRPWRLEMSVSINAQRQYLTILIDKPNLWVRGQRSNF